LNDPTYKKIEQNQKIIPSTAAGHGI